MLARQFDDTKWTDQGSSKRALKEWDPEDVSKWAKGIDGIPESVAESLEKNKITGRELVALNMEGLKMMGIERPGTLCLLLDEINVLKRANQDHVTLIEHSPYCFGLIIDYLRLKNLHFLEYSGTRQLAEDIERVRLLFGDQQLSIYGICTSFDHTHLPRALL